MSKDTYTYKEILLGLRNEFIDIESELRELKQYTLANKQYVSDFNYHLSQLDKDHLPELRVHVERRQSELMKRLRNLLGRFTYYNNQTSALMVKSNNGIYYPLAGKPFKLGVNPEYKEEFESLARKLLDSDFAAQMNFKEVTAVDSNDRAAVSTRWYEPHLRLNSRGGVAQIDYIGRTDRIKYSASSNMPLTQELLDEMLSLEFPKDAFSEYHQELIEQNPDSSRPILLPSNHEPTTLKEFRIVDYGYGEKIYLKARHPQK